MDMYSRGSGKTSEMKTVAHRGVKICKTLGKGAGLCTHILVTLPRTTHRLNEMSYQNYGCTLHQITKFLKFMWKPM